MYGKGIIPSLHLPESVLSQWLRAGQTAHKSTKREPPPGAHLCVLKKMVAPVWLALANGNKHDFPGN